MINFSFAITVCNEAAELNRLLTQIKKCVSEGDEIVIQVDQNNTTEEVLKVVENEEIYKKLHQFLRESPDKL